MALSTYGIFQRALALLQNKDHAQAAFLLEKAKRLYPEKASIREALARAYYNYGQYDLALREFEKALEIEPTNHYAHFGLGLCLERRGEPTRALGHLKMAVTMEPAEEVYRMSLRRMTRKSPLKSLDAGD